MGTPDIRHTTPAAGTKPAATACRSLPPRCRVLVAEARREADVHVMVLLLDRGVRMEFEIAPVLAAHLAERLAPARTARRATLPQLATGPKGQRRHVSPARLAQYRDCWARYQADPHASVSALARTVGLTPNALGYWFRIFAESDPRNGSTETRRAQGQA